MGSTVGIAAPGRIAITREEMLKFLLWLKMHDWPPERVALEYTQATGERDVAYRLALWKAAAKAARRAQ